MDTKLSRVELRSAIIGMTLGDAYLVRRTNRPIRNVRIQYAHSPKQMAYGIWKSSVIEQLTGFPIQPYSYQTRLSNGKSYEVVQFTSRAHPLIRRIRTIAYPDNVKTITAKLLSYLTPFGLAIWYMDDGSINITKKNGKLRGRQIFMHTACPENEVDAARDYFLCTWGIEWKKFRIRQDSQFFSLRANAENAIKFFQLISQYVHPSMRYKIDMQYHNNTGRTYRRVQERIAELKEKGLYFGSEDMIPTPVQTERIALSET